MLTEVKFLSRAVNETRHSENGITMEETAIYVGEQFAVT